VKRDVPIYTDYELSRSQVLRAELEALEEPDGLVQQDLVEDLEIKDNQVFEVNRAQQE